MKKEVGDLKSNFNHQNYSSQILYALLYLKNQKIKYLYKS